MGSIIPTTKMSIGGCPNSSVEQLTTIEVCVSDISRRDGLSGFPGRTVNKINILQNCALVPYTYVIV